MIIFKLLSDIIIILKPLSDIKMMMNDVNFEEGTFIFYQEIFYLVWSDVHLKIEINVFQLVQYFQKKAKKKFFSKKK